MWSLYLKNIFKNNNTYSITIAAYLKEKEKYFFNYEYFYIFIIMRKIYFN